MSYAYAYRGCTGKRCRSFPFFSFSRPSRFHQPAPLPCSFPMGFSMISRPSGRLLRRRARPPRNRRRERERMLRAHYKKPLITVIHDLDRPAGVSGQSVQSRSRYSSRRTAVGNGFNDESKRRVAARFSSSLPLRRQRILCMHFLVESLPKRESERSYGELMLL